MQKKSKARVVSKVSSDRDAPLNTIAQLYKQTQRSLHAVLHRMDLLEERMTKAEKLRKRKYSASDFESDVRELFGPEVGEEVWDIITRSPPCKMFTPVDLAPGYGRYVEVAGLRIRAKDGGELVVEKAGDVFSYQKYFRELFAEPDARAGRDATDAAAYARGPGGAGGGAAGSRGEFYRVTPGGSGSGGSSGSIAGGGGGGKSTIMSEPTFSDYYINEAIRAFLQFGEETMRHPLDKCKHGHNGYFSGPGAGASALRYHLAQREKLIQRGSGSESA